MREIAEEQTAIAGIKRARVLSLVEKLHREGALSFEQFAAAGILRDAVMAEVAPSEGVSSYGSNITAAQPSAKADRLGRRLTGFMITLEGRVMHLDHRKSRQQERALEDALFEAVGIRDMDGKPHVNMKHADLLVRACSHTEPMLTLTGMALELGSHYAPKWKQPPFALGIVSGWLGRLAQYYRLAK